MESFFRWDQQDLLLRVSIQANARQDKVGDLLDGRLKLYIQAPAIDGKANERIVKFLAKLFKTTKSSIDIEENCAVRHKNAVQP